MKSFFKILSVALLLCTFAASCGSDSTEPEPAPTPSLPKPDDKDDKIVISENTDLSPTISQDGESKTVRFTAKKPWQASVDDTRAAADWLYVSPASGEAGEAELTITAERNETPDERTGYVKIVSGNSSVTISVTQKQRDALTVSPSKKSIDAPETEFEIEVRANIQFEVEVKADWIEQISTRAMTTTVLKFKAERNNGNERTGTIVIRSGDKSETITITQRASGISIDRTFYELDANGDQVTVSVQGNTASASDIKYNITQGVEWIHGTETRAVTAQFTFNIDKNTTGVSREGEIEFTLPDKTGTKVRIVQSATVDLINIPDPKFKAYLVANFDKNKDDEISKYEASLITKIECRNEEIGSLEGIEHCTALTELDCGSNQLTTLDVSKNTALTELSCYTNQLTALDVSKNTALIRLICLGNKLKTLDLSKNTALTKLNCAKNQLKTLDLSKNTALTVLYFYNNLLTSLDVSNNTALTELDCGSNQLTTLDVSKNTALTELSCYTNQLTALDVSKNTALTELYCLECILKTLDLSKNTALTELNCAKNQLKTLDLSKNTALAKLNCNFNQLTALNIGKNTALTWMQCAYNNLTTLDVSGCSALTHLTCCNNSLTSLDVSKNTALTFLNCESNRLTTLDVSKTNLIHYDYTNPLHCSPMSTLQTLYLKTGWEIDGININRSTSYIPSQTEILYKD